MRRATSLASRADASTVSVTAFFGLVQLIEQVIPSTLLPGNYVEPHFMFSICLHRGLNTAGLTATVLHGRPCPSVRRRLLTVPELASLHLQYVTRLNCSDALPPTAAQD